MKRLLIINLLWSGLSMANPSISAMMEDSRVKIQVRLLSNESRGSFQLRSILEANGFKNDDGMVTTHHALDPLKIYNYLYEDGKYVFTVLFPPENSHFFICPFFLTFDGEAAQKLFEVIKSHLPKRDTDLLEQYEWGQGNYCDKSKKEPAKYRCFIHL